MRFSDDLGAVPWQSALLDRAGHLRSARLLPEVLADRQCQVVEVMSGRLAAVASDRLLLRPPESADVSRTGIFLGRADGVPYVAVAVDSSPVSPLVFSPGQVVGDVDASDVAAGGSRRPESRWPRWLSLRALGESLPPLHQELAVQAVAMVNWHNSHPRCPRCGALTEVISAGHERRCPADGSSHHPRSDPAVIMAVVHPGTGHGGETAHSEDAAHSEDTSHGDGTSTGTGDRDRGERILLGRQASWPTGRFSTLAGFVEPGETLEAAVRREVYEEVGIQVGQVRYQGSQPWPFPSSLMIGFCAYARTTQVAVDGIEIEQARWFTRAELVDAVHDGAVTLAPRLSISRQLIERWYGGQLPDPPSSGG
ncbi:MAG: NAD(+) diphosphatase [Angustibacter sp.]